MTHNVGEYDPHGQCLFCYRKTKAQLLRKRHSCSETKQCKQDFKKLKCEQDTINEIGSPPTDILGASNPSFSGLERCDGVDRTLDMSNQAGVLAWNTEKNGSVPQSLVYNMSDYHLHW